MDELTPQQIRDKMIDGYLRSYRKLNPNLPPEAVEILTKLAVADLEYVDNYRKLHPQAVSPNSSKPRPQPKISAEQIGDIPESKQQRLKLHVDNNQIGGNDAKNPNTVTVGARDGNPWLLGEMFASAMGRIRRILEGHRIAPTFREAADTCTIPKLAYEFFEVDAYFLTRDVKLSGTVRDYNPFRGLSDKDAGRLYQARIIDIANRSTGVLGHWWVK
jgi:hypothetical protein